MTMVDCDDSLALRLDSSQVTTIPGLGVIFDELARGDDSSEADLTQTLRRDHCSRILPAKL